MIILIYLMIHFTLFHSTLPAFRNRRANTLPCAHRTLHPKGIGRTPIHDCRPQHFNISVAEEVNNHSTAETCIMGTGPRIGPRDVTTKLELTPLDFALNDDAAVPVIILLNLQILSTVIVQVAIVSMSTTKPLNIIFS